MGTKTLNYSLTKPAQEDFYDIEEFNANAEIIDAELKKVNERVDRTEAVKTVTLTAEKWSSVAPHTQRVAVPGLKFTDDPDLVLDTPSTLSTADTKLRLKYTAMITDGLSEDGYMTFYCGVKKPIGDFSVKLRGVSTNG